MLNHLTADLGDGIAKPGSARPTQKSRYFNLSPEIRNKITRLVIAPGKVYLRDPHDHGPKTIARSKEPRTSFGYLATCTQFYDEGIRLFYEENVFYLPPGDVQDTRTYLQEIITPQHRIWIRHFGMALSTTDPRDVDLDDEGVPGFNFLRALCRILLKTWFDKVACALGRNDNHRVEGVGEPHIDLQGIPGSENVEFPSSRIILPHAWDEHSMVIAKSTMFVWHLVKAKIREIGPERARKWLLTELERGSLGTV